MNYMYNNNSVTEFFFNKMFLLYILEIDILKIPLEKWVIIDDRFQIKVYNFFTGGLT